MTGFAALAIGLGQAASGISRGMVAEDQRLRNLRSQNLEAFARFREMFPDADPSEMIAYREELAGGMNYLRNGLPGDDVIQDLTKRQKELRRREKMAHIAAEEATKKQIGDLFLDRTKTMMLGDDPDDKVFGAIEKMSEDFDPAMQKIYAETIRPSLPQRRKDLQREHTASIIQQIFSIAPGATDRGLLKEMFPNAPAYVIEAFNNRIQSNIDAKAREQQALEIQRKNATLAAKDQEIREADLKIRQEQWVVQRRSNFFKEINERFAGAAIDGDKHFPAYQNAVHTQAKAMGIPLTEEDVTSGWGALVAGAHGNIKALESTPTAKALLQKLPLELRGLEQNLEQSRETHQRAGEAHQRAGIMHDLQRQAQELNIKQIERNLSTGVANIVRDIAKEVDAHVLPYTKEGQDTREMYEKVFKSRLLSYGIDISKLPPTLIEDYYTTMAAEAAGTTALQNRAAGIAAATKAEVEYEKDRDQAVKGVGHFVAATLEATVGKSHAAAMAEYAKGVAREYAITEDRVVDLLNGMPDLKSYAAPDKYGAFAVALRKRAQEQGIPTVTEERQTRMGSAAQRHQTPALGSFIAPGALGTMLSTEARNITETIERITRELNNGREPPAMLRAELTKRTEALVRGASAASKASDIGLFGPQTRELAKQASEIYEKVGALDEALKTRAAAPPAQKAAETANSAAAARYKEALDIARRVMGGYLAYTSADTERMAENIRAEANARWSRSKSGYQRPLDEELLRALEEVQLERNPRREPPASGMAGP